MPPSNADEKTTDNDVTKSKTEVSQKDDDIEEEKLTPEEEAVSWLLEPHNFFRPFLFLYL